jgi:diaminopimelate decarboxylase
VGSQTTNFENYVQALALCANLLKEANERGYHKMNLVDIGGGFPAPYDETVKPFRELAASSTASSSGSSPGTSRSWPSPAASSSRRRATPSRR